MQPPGRRHHLPRSASPSFHPAIATFHVPPPSTRLSPPSMFHLLPPGYCHLPRSAYHHLPRSAYRQPKTTQEMKAETSINGNTSSSAAAKTMIVEHFTQCKSFKKTATQVTEQAKERGSFGPLKALHLDKNKIVIGTLSKGFVDGFRYMGF
ncbi:UNVERIFIED_CONTAM: hypothetical protein Sradi_6822700 [Sesamum radiatum]|uniref:Uncharacterized protein n=1 Tax=Sesamum radiatum TaxID=300843 RepID=A0AAW2JSY1_SESRA